MSNMKSVSHMYAQTQAIGTKLLLQVYIHSAYNLFKLILNIDRKNNNHSENIG